MDLRFTQRHHALTSQTQRKSPSASLELTMLSSIICCFQDQSFKLTSSSAIDWAPSLTVEETQANPFHLSFTDVDDGVMVTPEEESNSSSKHSIIVKNAKVFIRWRITIKTGQLVWAAVTASSVKTESVLVKDQLISFSRCHQSAQLSAISTSSGLKQLHQC